VILSPGPDLVLEPEVLPAVHSEASVNGGIVSNTPASPEGGLTLEQAERHHIVSVLKQTEWRIEGSRGAARLLNLNPSTLRSRMKKLGIRRSAAESS